MANSNNCNSMFTGDYAEVRRSPIHGLGKYVNLYL